MAEIELDAISERGLDDLRKIVALTHSNLEKISRILDNIDKEKRKEMYKGMPGVSGYFDGVYLIGEDGSKYEVPANYAAKSRIVFGDTLKMIEEDGKKLFKKIAAPAPAKKETTSEVKVVETKKPEVKKEVKPPEVKIEPKIEEKKAPTPVRPKVQEKIVKPEQKAAPKNEQKAAVLPQKDSKEFVANIMDDDD